jgi:AraC-like DNA-binding protein
MRQALPNSRIRCPVCIVLTDFVHKNKASATNNTYRRLEVAWSKVFSFTDPFQYAETLRAADMQVFPTSKGEFRAELTQVTMNELWMQRFEENLPRVHKGAVSPGRRAFSFLTEDQPEVHNRGRVLSLGELCADDHEMQHGVTTGNFHFGCMSLKSEEFDAACKAIVGCEVDTEHRTRFLRPSPDLMHRLLKLHEVTGGFAQTTPQLFEIPEVVRALEQQLIHALVRCLTDGDVSKINNSTLSHKVIVARFEEFIEANPNTPLYLTEVCAAVGAAERTLRAACEKHVGMGPIRYLTLRRMHLVRRALLRAAPGTATVTQVATNHGFWELGRFAVAYREAFGEPPSVTLQRPPESNISASGAMLLGRCPVLPGQEVAVSATEPKLYPHPFS